MARRKRLTDLQVASLSVRPKAYFIADPELGGHYVRITPGGARSFCAVARDPHGKQVWSTIGSAEILKIDEAREIGADGHPADQGWIVTERKATVTAGLIRCHCRQLVQARSRKEKPDHPV